MTILRLWTNLNCLWVIIRSDMKWSDNTDYICKKGYERLWMLRRLKGLGASEAEMLDVYHKQMRSVLELAVPVWQPAITQLETKQIESTEVCFVYYTGLPWTPLNVITLM